MIFLTKFLTSTLTIFSVITVTIFSAITVIIFSVIITLPIFAESNRGPATFIKISY